MYYLYWDGIYSRMQGVDLCLGYSYLSFPEGQIVVTQVLVAYILFSSACTRQRMCYCLVVFYRHLRVNSSGTRMLLVYVLYYKGV